MLTKKKYLNSPLKLFTTLFIFLLAYTYLTFQTFQKAKEKRKRKGKCLGEREKLMLRYYKKKITFNYFAF